MNEIESKEYLESKEILEASGMGEIFTSKWRVSNIKETAMNRCNVKKSRRPHIRRVLDEAFHLMAKDIIATSKNAPSESVK